MQLLGLHFNETSSLDTCCPIYRFPRVVHRYGMQPWTRLFLAVPGNCLPQKILHVTFSHICICTIALRTTATLMTRIDLTTVIVSGPIVSW